MWTDYHNKIAWHAAELAAIHSASDEDNAVDGCFLKHQEIASEPRLKV